MSAAALILAALLLAPVVAVRLLFLAPGRAGWLFYVANLVGEFFVKKARGSRLAVELTLVLAGLASLGLAHVGAPVLTPVLVLLLALELAVARHERRLLTTCYSQIDPIGLRRATPETTRGLAHGYPTPSTHPELVVNLVGPFVARLPRYQLGALLVGREFELRLVVANHSTVPTQTGIRLRTVAAEGLALEGAGPESVTLLDRLVPGGHHVIEQRWKVTAAAPAAALRFELEWGHLRQVLEVHHTGISPAGPARIAAASISRYPGGCRSAFAWRGDMDLYDESTHQSIEGLEATFGLAARYAMPQTMYLSTRLSVDADAARQWADHYGVDRGAGRIPAFVDWMRDHVEFRHSCSYPFTSAKRFVIELGNHGHLHFGTDTAGAAENGWKPKARMGAGDYPWLGKDRSSFGEQRDNALRARELCERLFGFSPKSWAMPNRTNDRHTAAAMEAAGCEVLSDSNVRTRHNVLLQPPPHHPDGSSAVELTKRYPGDPQHVYHVAMNHFWIHRAHRRGIPVVFMCHQHLRAFDGHACTRFTEHTLRYVLTRFHGDLHVNTVYGIGKYWREILSPRTARVTVSTQPDRFHVDNPGDLDLVDAPVDVRLTDGRRFTQLVSVPPGRRVTFPLPC